MLACGGEVTDGTPDAALRADAIVAPDAAPRPDAGPPPLSYHLDPELAADELRLLRLITGEEPLSDGTRIRERKSELGRRRAREILRDELSGAGYALEEQAFFFDLPGVNLIATLPATEAASAGTVLVGAHYDTVRDCPGADDNGTGSVAIVAVAKRLAAQPVRHRTLIVVLFDLEELGLYGSEALAQRYDDTQGYPDLMINVDMIGYDEARVGDVHVYDAEPELAEGLDLLAARSGFSLVHRDSEGGPGGSDSASFLMRGVPTAWLFEPTINPTWHRANDVIEQLHVDYMVHVSLWLETMLTDALTTAGPWPTP